MELRKLPFVIEQTGKYIYRWLKRYDGTLQSLADRSHRPHSHPNQHTQDEIKLILPFDSNDAPPTRKVPPRKYEMLAAQPTTRVIPYYGLCLNRRCSPQFEKCFHCGSFIPDPQYKEYITANIERLQKVNDQILKKHGNPTVLQQNLKDIQTFSIYLEKMNATEDNQRRSNVV